MTPATDGLMHVVNRITRLAQPIVVTADASRAERGFLSARAAIIALAILGIGLRLLSLLSDRCLWIDEAMLALNLVGRTPRQLLEPLDWNQGAPAGFLLLSKSAIELFGVAEWSLRLVPFVGSAIGVLGFAWLSRRLLAPQAAVMAMGLFAVSPFLISYAGECKQYATDAALTIGMFAAGVGLLHGETSPRRWLILAVGGSTAIWFSHPVAFVLGGIGSALFLDAVVAGDRGRAMACLAAIGSWLVSFGTCYLICLRQLGNNQYLLDYWGGHFLPLPPWSQGDLMWVADHFFGFIAFPGGLGGTEVQAGGIAAALCLIGLAALIRERWPVAVALALPALLALGASGVNKYPFAGRLLLFLVPLLVITVARGAWLIATALGTGQPLARVIILGLVFLAPAIESYQGFRRPPRHEQITPILDMLRDQWQPGDAVYVYYGAVPGVTFYTREHPLPPGVILGEEHRKERTRYRDDLGQLAGKRRVWLIFSHPHQSEDTLIEAYAESLGVRLREVRTPGVAALLYDFGTRP